MRLTEADADRARDTIIDVRGLKTSFTTPLGPLKAVDGARLEACAFRIADTPLAKFLRGGEGQAVHVAGHLRRSAWQGQERVELLIEDAAEPQR